MKSGNKIAIFLLLICSCVYAQDKRADRIKSLKVAFITTELELSASESEKFWPVYNAYESKQYRLRNQVMKNLRQKIGRDLDNMHEKEALALVNQLQDTEKAIHDNRMQLLNSLRKLISPSKILKLKKAEEDFSRRLLKQYRGKRG